MSTLNPQPVVVEFKRRSLDGNTNQGVASVTITVCGACGVLVSERRTHLDWHTSIDRFGDQYVDADTIEPKPYEPLGERFAKGMGITPPASGGPR